MTMNETVSLMLATAAGISLGAMFFGGLWWTIRKSFSSHQPALWFLCSLLLRTWLVVAGFYFVTRGRWDRLLVCLLGFIAARLIVTRFTRPEVGHAP
jgi:F1F0 ATPase subunit 2